MVYVFISHSKKDRELVRIIDLNFRSVGITPLFMEFMPERKPPYKKIENNVNISSAIFLFLTQNVKSSDFTQNWISFEVGLAKKANKSLFVVEDVNSKVHFPVAYLTDYILYEATQIEDWQNIQRILQNINQAIENNKLILGFTIGGAVLGALADEKDRVGGGLIGGFAGLILGGILTSLNAVAKVSSVRVRCPNSKCGIEFNYYSKFKKFQCPSCRTELQFVM